MFTPQRISLLDPSQLRHSRNPLHRLEPNQANTVGIRLIPFSDADVRHRSLPVVNIALIGVNALVFVYLFSSSGTGYLWGGSDLDLEAFFLKWGFIPKELTGGISCTYHLLSSLPDVGCVEVTSELKGRIIPDLAVIQFQGGALLNIESSIPTWATIFSSMFIHVGLIHFAGNMAFLWVFGDNMEDRLGHFKYLLFYLGTGVAATMTQLAIDPGSQAPLVGASGAVSGVMGAYLMLFPFNRIRALVIFYFITVVELQYTIFLGIFIFYQILISIGFLGTSAGANVAFMAHVGGFVCGAAVVSVYKLVIGEPVLPLRHRSNPWDYWYRSGRGPD